MSPTRLRFLNGLALVWLLTGHAGYVPDAAIGWGDDTVHHVAGGVAAVLVAVGVSSSILLIFGRWMRGAGLALAGTILGMTFVSESYFANYRVFVALLLLIACLAPRDPGEWALRLQCSLVYVGSAVDKLFHAEFREGVVVRALLDSVRSDGSMWAPGHILGIDGNLAALFSRLPHVAIVALSLGVIGLEAALAVAYLRRSPVLPWLASTLHLGIYLATGSSFGVFMHATLLSAYLLGEGERLVDRTAAGALLVYGSSPLAHPAALVFGVGIAAWVRRRELATSPANGKSC